jgi:hypothetical protein
METLTLNDGTVVNGHIIDNGDGRTIFVYLDGMTVVQGVTLFADPAKSKKVTAMNHGTEHVYEGYTELDHASHEYGNCNLTMRRGSDA